MAIISFEGVSKKFMLHHEGRGKDDVYWALRDVSFEVPAGQSFALVGHNGAGKSTALKLMTRILEPTHGSVRVVGRVAALLELGSGFHPDLSGRENVFLYGSLLGLGRRDMAARMDEIVEFAGIGAFLDTEVKHYSSGMYTRLAFAAATSVEPEVLITDEVLAVGDEAFQRKCMERIYQYRQQGRTIIFVSHALDTVRALCDRAIWLDHGAPQALGPAGEVINAYLADTNIREAAEKRRRGVGDAGDLSEAAWRFGSREVEIARVELLGVGDAPQELFYTGEPLTIRMHYLAKMRIERPQFGLAVYHAGGTQVFGPNNDIADAPIAAVEGAGYVDYRMPELLLLPGEYRLTVAIHDRSGMQRFDFHEQRYRFTVRSHTLRGYGLVAPPGEWRQTIDD